MKKYVNPLKIEQSMTSVIQGGFVIKVLATSFILFFGFSANAILIEPYFGYEVGKTSTTSASDGSNSSSDTTGTALGLRLGYKFLLPWVALDYTTVSGKSKGSTAETDFTRSSLGAVVGADLPIGLRVYAGYGFQDDFKDKGTNGDPDQITKGTYTKGGIGFKIIPMVALNLEHTIHSYNKVNLGAGAGDENISTYFSKVEYNTTMLSLSVPISL